MYASRVVTFYIFKENSFCTWHFMSFWSSYPYLTPVLLSQFLKMLISKTAIQNDLLMSIITVTMSGNWSVIILYFLLSFCVCFLSLLLLMVTLLPGKCISSPQTSCFLWADLRDPAPPPQNQEVGLICLFSSVCCCWKVRWISSEKCHSSTFRTVVMYLWCSIQTKVYIIFISR